MFISTTSVTFSVLYVQVCFISFLFIIFLSGSFQRKRIFATGWFVLMENNNCIPRTFEPEMHKIFKNIQPQPKT